MYAYNNLSCRIGTNNITIKYDKTYRMHRSSKNNILQDCIARYPAQKILAHIHEVVFKNVHYILELCMQ